MKLQQRDVQCKKTRNKEQLSILQNDTRIALMAFHWKSAALQVALQAVNIAQMECLAVTRKHIKSWVRRGPASDH